jgi:predicted GNAT superfamily acetyltransferase
MIVQPQGTQPQGAAGRDGIEIRRVRTADEYEACVAVQLETWGPDFTERVPATILRVAQYIGGVTAGAFAPDGSLLGFVFGMTGVRDGRFVHWSDLLAVRPTARDRGLGRRLKLYQRELVREVGVDTMYWTFDPLVARNAHLNLTRLGARVAEYAQDMYGDQLGKSLNPGLGTDRFIVRWDLARPPLPYQKAAVHGGRREAHRRAEGGSEERGAPVVEALPRVSLDPTEQELVDAPTVQVEIPNDIDAVFARNAHVARRWRDVTRRAFLWYLERGYAVHGFECDETSGRTYYELTRASRDR